MARDFVKDPDAVLDYQWDWSAWLAGDTIETYTVTASDGLTVDTDSSTSTAVTAWLSGGVAEQRYTVTCHVETVAGREDDRTITVTVMER